MSNTRKKLQRLFKPPTETTEPAFAPRDLSAPPKEFDTFGNPVQREELLRVKEDPREVEAEREDAIKRTNELRRAGTRRDIPTSLRNRLTARSDAASPAPIPSTTTAQFTGPSSGDFRKAQEAWKAAQQKPQVQREEDVGPLGDYETAFDHPPRPSRASAKSERVRQERELAKHAPPSYPQPKPIDVKRPELQRSHPLQLERDAALRAHARELREGSQVAKVHATSALPKPTLQSPSVLRMVEESVPPATVGSPTRSVPDIRARIVFREMVERAEMERLSENAPVQKSTEGSSSEAVDDRTSSSTHQEHGASANESSAASQEKASFVEAPLLKSSSLGPSELKSEIPRDEHTRVVEISAPTDSKSAPQTEPEPEANHAPSGLEIEEAPFRFQSRNIAREEELALVKTPAEVISHITVHAEAITPATKVEYLERALSEKLRTSHKLQAYKLLSTAYAQLDEPLKEIETLTAMSKVSPNDPWPKLRLVQIYREKLRDSEKALFWAEAALQTAPWHGQARALVQLLRQQSSLN